MEFLVEILTAREFEILRLLLAERTTGKIAEILHVSPKTVAERPSPD
jgi:two-component system invasion response regulator UvrY